MKTTINEFRDNYAFLSNFHPTPVEVDRVIYPTVENAYQAMKTLEFDLRTPFVDITPSEAKKLGNQLKIQNDWDTKKKLIMEHLLRQKFKIPKYKEKLLATGNATLVEGNWWHDNYWGKCRCDKCKSYTFLRESNVLGNLLMSLRRDLKQTTCHTGGAKGADMLFETLCSEAGFNVISYSFDSHSTKSNFRKILSEDELANVNNEVSKVGILIGRVPAFKRPTIIKFLQRNMYQVLDTEMVIAVGVMNWSTTFPHGGTAWAVGAGILLGKPVLFFDQDQNSWYKFSVNFDTYWEPISKEHLNIAWAKDFTGIGTRKLNDNGRKAIETIVKIFKEAKCTYHKNV